MDVRGARIRTLNRSLIARVLVHVPALVLLDALPAEPTQAFVLRALSSPSLFVPDGVMVRNALGVTTVYSDPFQPIPSAARPHSPPARLTDFFLARQPLSCRRPRGRYPPSSCLVRHIVPRRHVDRLSSPHSLARSQVFLLLIARCHPRLSRCRALQLTVSRCRAACLRRDARLPDHALIVPVLSWCSQYHTDHCLPLESRLHATFACPSIIYDRSPAIWLFLPPSPYLIYASASSTPSRLVSSHTSLPHS